MRSYERFFLKKKWYHIKALYEKQKRYQTDTNSYKLQEYDLKNFDEVFINQNEKQ